MISIEVCTVGRWCPGLNLLLCLALCRSLVMFTQMFPISDCYEASLARSTLLRSVCACCCQDMDLYSINYLHFGAPKVWYGVPPASSQRLEVLASSLFPMQRKACAEFTRHKTSVIAPSKVSHDIIVHVELLFVLLSLCFSLPRTCVCGRSHHDARW